MGAVEIEHHHAVLVGRFPHSDEHSLRERSFFLDEGPRSSGGQRITLLAPHAQLSHYPWKQPPELLPLALRHIAAFLRAHRPEAA